ncbi:MAG TPA: HD domain-containing protein [Desulfurivibrio alkaliphilus]|uniref:HD domain-containing protein n=1 Tax=Desulfurivibrio alkaliphilus TaxID=427923 RepID=A0A7C2TL90_9BACT|nr:HD domain-containing protein [Desulfurivibrio alkaliphilus]
MNTSCSVDPVLLALKKALDEKESRHLSPLATLSRSAWRRGGEPGDHRQSFAVDTDRVLHSRAYTRYIDKTQVFYMVRNDHITHRVLHVQLVSKIARTIGRFLGLNEDLIEAIALGHDLGHPPFGHDGEKVLDQLCREHGLPSFQHNLQSVIFLEKIEKGGRGLNLTLQVLDGIMCHDGEIHHQVIKPHRDKDFAAFDREFAAKLADPGLELLPMTLEGCVVRLADTIAYIGRDIEDAIELQLISREDIPRECTELLGRSNGSIVYRLVTDLIANGIKEDQIGFSPPVGQALGRLKEFNYQAIYLNPLVKQGFDLIAACYRTMFGRFLDDLHARRSEAPIFTEYLRFLAPHYREQAGETAVVRDFIAGMTDEYFLNQARICGCRTPEMRRTLRGGE